MCLLKYKIVSGHKGLSLPFYEIKGYKIKLDLYRNNRKNICSLKLTVDNFIGTKYAILIVPQNP